MVRIFAIITLVGSFLFGDVVMDKVRNFMSSSEYSAKRSLVEILFKNRGEYILSSNTPNSLKIMSKLKENGLINLFISRPTDIIVTFSTSSNNNSLLFMRVVIDSLNSLGYNYILTKNMKKTSSTISWSVIIKTNHILDPTLFAKELQKRDTSIIDISKNSSTTWQYSLNTSYSKLTGQTIDTDRFVELNRPQEDYFLEVSRVKVLKVETQKYDSWHPYIVFYDNNLNIVDKYKSEERAKRLTLKVPATTKYIKIGDNYTLENIKRGLSVYLDTY